MDPMISAAIVNAAGDLLGKLLDFARDSSPDAKTEKVLSKVYSTLANAVTPNSLRALIVLQEARSFQLPEQVVGKAQQLAARQEPDGKPLEADIAYRLHYLCLLGLALKGTSDFALTDLGAAFIDHARRDKHRYGKVFTVLAT